MRRKAKGVIRFVSMKLMSKELFSLHQILYF